MKQKEGKLMNKRGITLIELLVVVAIIGIIAAIAIPGYIGQQRRAARTEASTNLQNLRMLLEQKFADSGSYSPTAYCRTPFTATAPAATLTYAGTTAQGNTELEDYFCGFNPAGLNSTDQLSALSYNYKVDFFTSAGVATTTNAAAFTATATAKSDRRVAGDAICTIDQNNTRIGPCW
jgi:prepilin-type N-terminal cleavage/methylation domain-containing protein